MRDFLQSQEWAEFQRSLGREVLKYPDLEVEPLSGEAQPPAIVAKVIRHDLPFGKNYLYIPHGPVMDPERGREGTPRTKQDAEHVRGFVRGTQRASASYGMDFNQMIGGFTQHQFGITQTGAGLKNPVANFVKWLREEANRRKSIFVKAEPLTDNVAQVLVEAGFRKSNKEVQPSKTVIINLTKNEEELLSAMHHKTRYNIGVADKHNVVVTEDDDIEQFLKLLKKTAKRDKFHAHPDDYYQKLINFPGLETKLYFAKQNKRLLAAALVLIFGGTAYYLHGASDYKHRALMAPYALHWYIIKMLHVSGSMKYDLWGIDSHKWPGVTRFKLGWGGQTIECPGAFDLTISKFWHLAHKLVSRK